MTGKFANFFLFCALISIPCGVFSQGIFIDLSSPLLPVASVEVSPSDTERVRSYISNNTIHKYFRLLLVKDGKKLGVPVSGIYLLDDLTLLYHPMSPLGEGLQFEIDCTLEGEPNTGTFSTPSISVDDTPFSEVEQIFPRSTDIPCNELYFHVRFTQPMFPDPLAWKVVKVYDDGEVIPKIWRERSYWLDSNRVLVLMIHPGRVKRGIGLDVPFVEGKSYYISVSGALKDQLGRDTRLDTETEFFATPDDYNIPKVLHKKTKVPLSGTDSPLQLIFSEAMDYASIIDGAQITDTAGDPVKGYFWPLDDDATFEFFPEAEWSPGDYQITLGKVVSDLAGNRLNRPFEMSAVEDKTKDKPISFPFRIK